MQSAKRRCCQLVSRIFRPDPFWLPVGGLGLTNSSTTFVLFPGLCLHLRLHKKILLLYIFLPIRLLKELYLPRPTKYVRFHRFLDNPEESVTSSSGPSLIPMIVPPTLDSFWSPWQRGLAPLPPRWTWYMGPFLMVLMLFLPLMKTFPWRHLHLPTLSVVFASCQHVRLSASFTHWLYREADEATMRSPIGFNCILKPEVCILADVILAIWTYKWLYRVGAGEVRALMGELMLNAKILRVK